MRVLVFSTGHLCVLVFGAWWQKKEDRQSLLPKELARVAACRKTLGLLTCICFLFERYMHSCRIFAISKVAYGWIARTPAACLCKSLWSAVHVGSRHLCMASVWLRAALFGCLLCSWWVLWFGLRPLGHLQEHLQEHWMIGCRSMAGPLSRHGHGNMSLLMLCWT